MQRSPSTTPTQEDVTSSKSVTPTSSPQPVSHDELTRQLATATYSHEAAWFSPHPAPSDDTHAGLEAAVAPFLGEARAPMEVGPAEQTLLAEALTLIAHGYVLPESTDGQHSHRRRDPRRALDAINRAIALGRGLQPPCPRLVVLQRLRLRANALVCLRSYRPARDDLMEALVLLRHVCVAVRAAQAELEYQGADEHTGNHLSMVGLWCIAQWGTICFNLSLCARYLNCPDEALLWIHFASVALVQRGKALEVLGQDHPAAQYADIRVDHGRVAKGRAMLRRILQADTAERLMSELQLLQAASEGESFAGGMALVQAFVDRYLVTAVLRNLGIELPPVSAASERSPPPTPSPVASAPSGPAADGQSSGAPASAPPDPNAATRPRKTSFLASIASAFGGGAKKKSVPPPKPLTALELVGRLPSGEAFDELPGDKIERACLQAASEVAGKLTGGQLTDIAPCLSGHLPSFLQGSSSLAVRHGMVTLLDFALTNRASSAWRAASSFAEQRDTLRAIAVVPEFPFGDTVRIDKEADVEAADVVSAASPQVLPATPPVAERTPPELAMPSGDVAASPTNDTTSSPADTSPRSGQLDAALATTMREVTGDDIAPLLREYVMEERLVLFDFNPITTQTFLIAIDAPQLDAASPTEVRRAWSRHTTPQRSPAATNVDPAAGHPPVHLAMMLQTMRDDFIPDAVGASMTILTPPQRQALHGFLPQMLHGHHWHCVFSTREHGSSFNNMFQRVEGLDVVLLVVKPLNSNAGAFGALVTAPLVRNKSVTAGGGETFVFTFDTHACSVAGVDSRAAKGADGASGDDEPDSPPLPPIAVFHWSQRNSYFFESKPDHFSVGGGSSGAAIYIGEYMRQGSTYFCETFDSPPLTDTVGVGDFKIAAVELFSV